MNTIKNLETFISICEATLINAELDVIPWKEGMDEDYWKRKSFLSNNTMLTASKTWYKNRKIIYDNYHQALDNIRDEYLINNNERIIQYAQNKLNILIDVIEEFQAKHKMNHVKVMPKNQWFFKLKDWCLCMRKDITKIKVQQEVDLSNVRPDSATKKAVMTSITTSANIFFQFEDTEGNNIALTPNNWEEHKESFIEKRMDSYRADNLKRRHFAMLETDKIKDLRTKSTSEKLLKIEYSDFLSSEIENEDETPKFENIFNNLPSSDVYEYFKIHLLDNEIITNTDLDKFLISAFQNKVISTKIKLNDKGRKNKVRTIFYNFHQKSTSVHGKKPEYVRLLSDYFEGYNFNTTSTNWSPD